MHCIPRLHILPHQLRNTLHTTPHRSPIMTALDYERIDSTIEFFGVFGTRVDDLLSIGFECFCYLCVLFWAALFGGRFGICICDEGTWACDFISFE